MLPYSFLFGVAISGAVVRSAVQYMGLNYQFLSISLFVSSFLSPLTSFSALYSPLSSLLSPLSPQMSLEKVCLLQFLDRPVYQMIGGCAARRGGR